MTDTMQAIEISEPGGPEVLRPCSRPIPEPGHGEVLIRVAYAGINGPDIHQRNGLYRAPADASDLPGLEASGTIVAIGAGVSGVSTGDQVMALLPGGGYAEYAIAPALHCLPIPDGMTLEAASGIPETFFTVWSNVFMAGGLKAGQTFLVHGGAGGIGTTAVQLAAAFGARVFTTVGSSEKAALCQSLGAERSINYLQEDFVTVLKDAGRADLILDIVGGDYFPRNIKALKDEGRLQFIALQSGSKVEMRFGEVMLRRLTISGTTLRPQSVNAKAAIASELKTHVLPLLATGRIAPVIGQTFDLVDAENAHRAMAEDHAGKILLRVSGDT